MMIRSAILSDTDSLLRIEHRCFSGDRLSKRSVRYLLTKAHARTLVDEEQGIIRGYAMILLNRRISMARLYSFAVDPDFQHQGIASRLLVAMEQVALEEDFMSMRLEVRCDNQVAQQLYEKQGYKKFGRIAEYYDDHTDALRFEKSLLPHFAEV